MPFTDTTVEVSVVDASIACDMNMLALLGISLASVIVLALFLVFVPALLLVLPVSHLCCCAVVAVALTLNTLLPGRCRSCSSCASHAVRCSSSDSLKGWSFAQQAL